MDIPDKTGTGDIARDPTVGEKGGAECQPVSSACPNQATASASPRPSHLAAPQSDKSDRFLGSWAETRKASSP